MQPTVCPYIIDNETDPGMVANAFNPNIQRAQAVRSLWVQGQPNLQNEFKDSQGYPKKPSLKEKRKKEKKRRTPKLTKISSLSSA